MWIINSSVIKVFCCCCFWRWEFLLHNIYLHILKVEYMWKQRPKKHNKNRQKNKEKMRQSSRLTRQNVMTMMHEYKGLYTLGLPPSN